MIRATSRRPPTAEVRVQFQASPCGIFCALEQGSLRAVQIPSVSTIAPFLQTHSIIHLPPTL